MNYVRANGTSRKSNADQSFRTLIDQGFAPELARATLTKRKIGVLGVQRRRPRVATTVIVERLRNGVHLPKRSRGRANDPLARTSWRASDALKAAQSSVAAGVTL